MEQKSLLNQSNSEDILSSSRIVTESYNNNSNNNNKSIKRKYINNDSSKGNKRSKLNELIFYDGNRHPAAVLHELRPEISYDNFHFEIEEISPKQTGFRCSITIDKDLSEPIIAIGLGRSKQLAKNMAAQQALMKLYPTYRPPPDEILREDYDMHQQARFIPTRPLSLQNDPTTLIDSIRKHLTTKAVAIKTPLQLFYELFINNQRLNASTLSKNRVEINSDNEENLVVVRVTAMDQQFWSVNAVKSVAQNDACQLAIETLCNVSFRQVKDEFIRALQSISEIKFPSDITTDDNNNNNNNDNNTEEQHTTTEFTTVSDLSSPSFLMPFEES